MTTLIIFSIVALIALGFFIAGIVIAVKTLVHEARAQSTTHSEHRYAGFWKRVLAAIIDSVIVGIASIVLYMAIGRAATLAGWCYYIFMESSQYQATLGKMIVGIKVTDIHGNRISPMRSAGRYFAKILSSLTFFVGYIMIAFTHRKQGLHDMLADTLVINK